MTVMDWLDAVANVYSVVNGCPRYGSAKLRISKMHQVWCRFLHRRLQVTPSNCSSSDSVASCSTFNTFCEITYTTIYVKSFTILSICHTQQTKYRHTPLKNKAQLCNRVLFYINVIHVLVHVVSYTWFHKSAGVVVLSLNY